MNLYKIKCVDGPFADVIEKFITASSFENALDECKPLNITDIVSISEVGECMNLYGIKYGDVYTVEYNDGYTRQFIVARELRDVAKIEGIKTITKIGKIG